MDQNETLTNKLKFVTYQALSEEEKACKMEELLKDKEKNLKVKTLISKSLAICLLFFFKVCKILFKQLLIWPKWGNQRFQISQAM